MRIGVDVMGGDNAPHAILDGAIEALSRLGESDRLVLVGDGDVIRKALADTGSKDDRVEIIATTQTVAMDEPPVEAVRAKPDSSITVLAELASPRKAAKRGVEPLDAIVSAGNTGACITAAQMHMRRLRNVHRPGIGVTLPTFSGPIVLIDVGANIEPKPHHLAQYGVMGDIYARLVLGIEKPRVALMNVGGEEQKGTTELKSARDTLRSAEDLNFIGYVEGRGVFNGEADVVITDGVVGNVMLKLAEGLSEGIFKAIAREVRRIDPGLAQRFAPVVEEIYSQHDYHEYGGAPLLGVNGVCIIAHGSSEARTIVNAVVSTLKFVETGVNEAIINRLGAIEEALRMTQGTAFGVRITGAGSAVPSVVLTNADLEKMMDTTDEWIVKRTGIHSRRVCDPETESEFTLARDALQRALDDAKMMGAELDLIIHASVTSEMTCPSNACRIASAIGAGSVPAFDLVAACSGFAYGLNIAESLIRSGRHHAIGIVGCDALSTVSDFTERTVSILFGDAAGAVVIKRDPDPSVGCIYQKLGADSDRWESLYMPRREREIPEWDRDNVIKLGCLRMSGREVFKFAVSKFREVIQDALDATGLEVDQISQFVCHQSNERILEASKEKVGLPDDKLHINIGEYGNSSAGSVGLVFDELWRAGKIKRGEYVVFVAFGGGLTWSSSVWKI